MTETSRTGDVLDDDRQSSASQIDDSDLPSSNAAIKGTIRRVGASSAIGGRQEIGSVFEGDLELEGHLEKYLGSILENKTSKDQTSKDKKSKDKTSKDKTSKDRASPKPSAFKLSELDPKKVKSIGRPKKRDVMRDLANKFTEEKVCVAIHSEGGDRNPEFLPQGRSGEKGKTLSFAALLALYMALKGSTELFAELVGCATPKTVEELKEYLRPPLITLQELPMMIHCASRNITLNAEE
jgi:hypothetical protein